MKSRIEDFFWFFIGGVLGFIILTALTGCLEWGPTLKEQGRVAKLTYIPSTEQTDLMFFPHGNGGGSVGFVTSGHRARYIVEFECTHGRFTVDRQDLWKRLKEGQDVTIYYREGRDSEGNVKDLDFIDAWPNIVEQP